MNTSVQRQGGFTLVVGLIMLILMTVLALSTFNFGNTSFQVVSNLQQRSEAASASQEALDRVISSLAFVNTPNSVFSSTNCPSGVTVSNGLCVDLNGDGKILIQVALNPAPSCVQAKVLKNATLDLTNAYDAGCVVGQQQSFGIEGSTGTGDSLCADTVWNVDASATDPVTQAQSVISEGIAVRSPKDSVDTSCP